MHLKLTRRMLFFLEEAKFFRVAGAGTSLTFGSSKCRLLKWRVSSPVSIAVQEDCALPLWLICDIFKRPIFIPLLNEIPRNGRSMFLTVISLIFRDYLFMQSWQLHLI